MQSEGPLLTSPVRAQLRRRAPSSDFLVGAVGGIEEDRRHGRSDNPQQFQPLQILPIALCRHLRYHYGIEAQCPASAANDLVEGYANIPTIHPHLLTWPY